MDFYEDPLWEWNKPYLEAEDVRPVDEQGDAEVWGVPEALNQYICQFLTKNFFLLLRRVSKGAKCTAENSRGLLFGAYQERLGEICWGVSRGLLLDVHRQKLKF